VAPRYERDRLIQSAMRKCAEFVEFLMQLSPSAFICQARAGMRISVVLWRLKLSVPTYHVFVLYGYEEATSEGWSLYH
jgi:hypothetical protein